MDIYFNINESNINCIILLWIALYNFIKYHHWVLINISFKRGISHGDVIDLNRENIPGYDVREFYVDLVSDLKDKGFWNMEERNQLLKTRQNEKNHYNKHWKRKDIYAKTKKMYLQRES